MSDRPILICYDGSDEAIRAIEEGARILGPRKAVVTDVTPLVTQAESVALLAPGVAGREFEEINEDSARERAQQGAEHARTAGFDAEARGAVAMPTWQGILDVADDVDAELILLGTRGYDGAKTVLSPSVSHAVAEHSGRPVLIIPPAHRRG
jgi:nucleotide-binding universal stress UspA family protein